MAKGKKRAPRGEDKNAFPLKSILTGAGVGAVLFLLLMLVVACAALRADISRETYPVIGLAAAALSSLAGGFAAVRPVHKNAIPYGALAGVIQGIFACTAAFAANSASASSKQLLLAAIMVIFSAAGGIAAVNIKRRRKV